MLHFFRVPLTILLLALSLTCSHAFRKYRHPEIKSAVFLSPKFVLDQGSVVNEYYSNIDFPRGHIAIKGFNAEVVDEAGHPVPLHETYLHHWVIARYYQRLNATNPEHDDCQKNKKPDHIFVRNSGICQNNSLGQYYGLGSETRGTDSDVPDPYGIEVGNPADIPAGYEEGWLLNVHAIDTRGVEDKLGCTECRCDLYNVSKDEYGRPLRPDYIGGLGCCYDHTQCRLRDDSESAKRNLYLRYTVKWIDWDEYIVPVKIYIFDVTDTWKRLDNSTGQNSEHECHVEYNIEPCSTSGMTNIRCTDSKRISLLMPIGGYIIYGVAHQHSGGIGSTLYGEDGRVLCSSIPTYGQGKEAGNEAGYIVGMSTCYPQPGSVKINVGETLILESNYSSAQRHTGVMGLFYILVADQLPKPRLSLRVPIAKQVNKLYSLQLDESAHVSVTCQDSSITELKIMGDKLVKVSEFHGFAIPNMTLSESFSIDSFVTTLTRLTSLKVLSLVSLGIWGPLPDKIHRLYSLELLDLSSNFMYGSIPPKISRLVKLHTLTLDSNYFNDTVPDWLDSFSNLTILSLKSNGFKGQIPFSISKIKTLTDLVLSHNELSGKLPDLSTLTNLRLLNIIENHLDSELPVMPKELFTVLLSNNSLSGEIPEQFGELHKLQHVDLSFNHLSGTPPSALFSLPNISYLNLGSNMLGGSLPDELSCGDKLGYVDLSSNKLIGQLPSCLNSTSDKRYVKIGGNCLSRDSQDQHEGSHCLISSKQSRGRDVAVVVAVISGAVLVMVLLGLGVLLLCKRCRLRTQKQHVLSKNVQDNTPTGISAELLANARFISQAAKLGTQAPVCRLFSFEELKEATNNFDSSRFLGEGSMGKIYKGRLENGTYVAIRSLSLVKKCSIPNLKAKLDLLSKLHHPHLVGFLGHGIDGGGQDDSSSSKVFLVYEYVPNGNYQTHLSESCPEKVFKWSDRLAILIGVAKAVHFLHTGVIPGCLNNRLKTNNILLDEHRIAKLSDYGMSIITEEIEKFEAKGEGLKSCHRTNIEDDVYNFGFILLESLVGPIVTGKGEAFLLNEMASFGSQDGRRRIVDPIVLTTCSQESLSIVVSITNKCIAPELLSRPSFEDVLWNLQYAAQIQATADSDQRSDSTT